MPSKGEPTELSSEAGSEVVMRQPASLPRETKYRSGIGSPVGPLGQRDSELQYLHDQIEFLTARLEETRAQYAEQSKPILVSDTLPTPSGSSAPKEADLPLTEKFPVRAATVTGLVFNLGLIGTVAIGWSSLYGTPPPWWVFLAALVMVLVQAALPVIAGMGVTPNAVLNAREKESG